MLHIVVSALFSGLSMQSVPFEPLELDRGGSVVLLGNALAERMQHHGWLETELQTRMPGLGLSFRNLGFSADELTVHQRTQGFGTWDDYLTRCDAGTIFAFFGYVESFAGPEGVDSFVDKLEAFVEHTRAQTYNGSTPPALVLFTSIPFEDIGNSFLPDAAEENDRIQLYNEAIASVARGAGVRCVDLFTPMQARYAEAEKPLTLNGIHLTEHGNEVLAEVIQAALLPELSTIDTEGRAAVRKLVLEKNLLWFNRYRATDGYNVYGGRSSLEYDGVTNYTVLQRELEVLDAMCANLDRRIQLVALGEADPGDGRTLPAQIPVATNRPGDGPQGEHTFLGGDEALDLITLAEGFSVNLYADEKRFPRLVNPVQMSWDTRGRLWVAVWPTYPHWQPGKEMNDALLVLSDEDGDGVADRSHVFADGLHNPTGFEFWNGGVFVANPPDLLFLRDTDGDDIADERVRVLHGMSSADTHHSVNSFVLGPDGALYFQEGIFHQSQIETIFGPVRSRDACAWRFEPRTWRVERYMAFGFLNPHGHVFDRWGQDFITDGTGNTNYYALPATGFLPQPDKHRSYFRFFEQRSRPAAATEILSSAHFPDENQGNYLIANVIGFQGVFQYELEEDGSGFGATETEPLLFSTDPRFRPSDLEVGPDGAVYVLDWHNPLIGHMQHHLRDPSRDKAHGRVLRVTCAGRELTEPVPIAGRGMRELLELLKSHDDRVRYRARIELSSKPSAAVAVATRGWVAGLDMDDPDYEHHRLEALWVGQQHNRLDRALLTRVMQSEDPRARAAGVRVLRALRAQDGGSHFFRLALAVADEHPRVRLEAVVALSFFTEPHAVQIALLALDQEMDRFLDYALKETVRGLEPQWKPALLAGKLIFGEAEGEGLAYLLRRLDTAELRRVAPSAPVWSEVLGRGMLPQESYLSAADGLAQAKGTNPCAELLGAIARADASNGGHTDHLLMGLFDALGDACNDSHATELHALAVDARRATTRRRATGCRMRTAASVAQAWEEAVDETSGGPTGLLDLLDAAPLVSDEGAREELFRRALELVQDPPNRNDKATSGRYVRVELQGAKRMLTLAEVEVLSNGTNVARAGAATQSSVEWGGVPERGIDGITSGKYSDNGQTHTAEDHDDPWWEVDLGADVPIDSIVVWNRTEGDYGERLDDLVVKVLDSERRSVYVERGGKAPEVKAAIELADPGLLTYRVALTTLASLRTREDEVARILVDRFDDPRLCAGVVSALRSISFDGLPQETLSELGVRVVARLTAVTDAELASPAGRELLALAKELAPLLDQEASALLDTAAARGPLVIMIRPVRDRMLYDRTELTVTASRPIELVFENVDIMPHNLLLAARGALARVGMAAEAMASDPDAWSRSFVPDLPEVLVATGLLQPGESQTLVFNAPSEPGDYPYVCTFPGHWVRMNGVMHVVDPASSIAVTAPSMEVEAQEASSTRPFVKSWAVKDLRRDLRKLKGVDPERGRRIFDEASCILCHRVAEDAGTDTGPDMREIAGKNGLSEILTQIFEPSRRIAEGYATEIFVTTDGLIHSGRVLEETDDFVLVQDDPFREDGIELPKEEIEERVPSNVSAMPEGLLSTFEKDEILDLVAFIKSLK